jgi:hypothetical protein
MKFIISRPDRAPDQLRITRQMHQRGEQRGYVRGLQRRRDVRVGRRNVQPMIKAIAAHPTRLPDHCKVETRTSKGIDVARHLPPRNSRTFTPAIRGG